jgi:hypothetical protein
MRALPRNRGVVDHQDGIATADKLVGLNKQFGLSGATSRASAEMK